MYNSVVIPIQDSSRLAELGKAQKTSSLEPELPIKGSHTLNCFTWLFLAQCSDLYPR